MADIEPIYDFKKLRTFLEKIGIHVEQADGAYRPVIPGDVRLQDIRNGKITFEDEGIFINGDNGEHQQIFLYKRSYNIEQYGKPRMHIRKCKTIQEFISTGGFAAKYRHANTASVPVINMDKGYADENVDNLPLCRYCKQMLLDEGKKVIKNSKEFVDILKETMGIDDQQVQVDVDIFGYTSDWPEISQEFREKHSYTCEKCGLKITDLFDYHYMHVHHKNHIKTDNRESNLQCLCMRCHSEIDDGHRERFSSGANRILLDEFNRKYPRK